MNARYIEHGNQCYDWGSFGWALESESADVLKYKYFIFLNSSVRGPFMPAYLKVCPSFLHNYLHLHLHYHRNVCGRLCVNPSARAWV